MTANIAVIVNIFVIAVVNIFVIVIVNIFVVEQVLVSEHTSYYST